MARIILKSPYLKPATKSRAANHLRYIATREGVVKPEDPKRQLPATQFQQQTIAALLEKYPDVAEFYEYQDFQQSPTRENADEFILRVAETHGELFESHNRYVDYIATRPGAVHIAEHGLFTDVGKPVVLDQVAKEVAEHKGNVWTHVISLRREDADRLGYSNVGEWMDLIRRQRNMLARQMNIDPKNFRWYAAFHDKDHHPHVHVMAWSTKPGEAWLSEKGIEGIKSALARDIFKQDLAQVYEGSSAFVRRIRTRERMKMALIAEMAMEMMSCLLVRKKLRQARRLVFRKNRLNENLALVLVFGAVVFLGFSEDLRIIVVLIAPAMRRVAAMAKRKLSRREREEKKPVLGVTGSGVGAGRGVGFSRQPEPST